MELIILGILLALGLGAGRVAERRHLSNLDTRELDNREVLVSDLRSFPGGAQPAPSPTLVVSETVISSDYFKSFIGTLRRIIGGELRSFESLMLRARREAVAQLAEQARRAGFDAVCNIRVERVDVSGGATRQRGVIVVSVQASGTAYLRTQSA